MVNDIDDRIKALEAEIDERLSFDQNTAGLEYALETLKKRAGVERRNSRKHKLIQQTP